MITMSAVFGKKQNAFIKQNALLENDESRD